MSHRSLSPSLATLGWGRACSYRRDQGLQPWSLWVLDFSSCCPALGPIRRGSLRGVKSSQKLPASPPAKALPRGGYLLVTGRTTMSTLSVVMPSRGSTFVALSVLLAQLPSKPLSHICIPSTSQRAGGDPWHVLSPTPHIDGF